MAGSAFRKIMFLLAILLSVAGIVLAAELIKLHDPNKAAARAAAESGLLSMMCGGPEDSKTDCSAVVTSEYGYFRVPMWLPVHKRDDQGQVRVEHRWVGFPVPVALIGQSYYLVMLIWLVLTGLPGRRGRWWHLWPMVLAGGAAAVSIVFIYIMVARVDQYCPICIAQHVINFLLLGAAVLLWPRGGGNEAGSATRRSPDESWLGVRHALAVLVCGIAVASIGWVQDYGRRVAAQAQTLADSRNESLEKLTQDQAFLFSAYRGTVPVEIPERATASYMGPRDALHHLVIFSDLQCPICKTFEGYFKQSVWPQVADRLRVTFRHFPLCTHCNSTQRGSADRPDGLHPQACRAAYATEAAGAIGGADGFWKMHDLILQNQEAMKSPTFGHQEFVRYAAAIGLDPEKFSAAMNSQQIKSYVTQDVQDGARLGVHGTPVVFLNGRQISNWQRNSVPFWKAVVADIVGSSPAPVGQTHSSE